MLLSAAATALALVGAAGAIFLIVRQQLHADVADQLRARAAIHVARDFTNIRELRPLADEPGSASGRGRSSGSESASRPQLPEPPTLPRLISADGSVLVARYPQLRYPTTPAARAVAAGQRAASLEDVNFRGDDLKILTVRAGPGRALQLAQSLASTDETLRRLLFVLVSVTGAGVLGAPFIGLLVAGGGLGPVRRLTRVAEDVARTGSLDHRIQTRGRDELASLGASFNAMLDRLSEMVETVERARRAQRQLVADASHELRTPLAALRANVELLALASANEVEKDELVTDVLQQLDGLTTLVSQLIDLAREELPPPEPAEVALDDVVSETVRRMEQNYPQLEFVAELEPTPILGVRESIARAVSNLIDNAAKWSPEHGRIHVALHDGVLQVRDRGPGIDDADLPHVFERFYRGTAGRDRPGSGLGLAIVAQVLSAHGGEVRAERPAGGGTLLTATFPRTPPGDS